MPQDAPPLDAEQLDLPKLDRPHPRLFQYYVFVALLTGPLSPIVILPLYFRYITLRYRFDESGVSMKWGILFRREVYLTYRRIQDIHLTRNILQRWMGLAKISLQTASGSSSAEMAIEGILEANELRDYLYGQMRGAKDESSSTISGGEKPPTTDRAVVALEGIRTALESLVERGSEPGGDS